MGHEILRNEVYIPKMLQLNGKEQSSPFRESRETRMRDYLTELIAPASTLQQTMLNGLELVMLDYPSTVVDS